MPVRMNHLMMVIIIPTMCLSNTTRILQALALLKEYALGQLLMNKRCLKMRMTSTPSTKLSEEYLPHTPRQSIDEVLADYKGKTAMNYNYKILIKSFRYLSAAKG